MKNSDIVSVWHMDATGSVVRPLGNRPIYYYAIVLALPQKGLPALPLFEFITDRHNVGNLQTALMSWWGHMASAFACRPDYIVIDFSWALLHSASIIFAQEPLTMHIHRLWALLKEDCEENERTVRLRICASHFIKSVSKRLAKMNLEKQVFVCVCVCVVNSSCGFISLKEAALFHCTRGKFSA